MTLLSDGVRYMQMVAGQTFRVRYYTESIGSVWDDELTLAKSGNDLFVSGVIHTLDTKEGSSDQLLLEQGRIKYGDSVIYLAGSIQTTSGTRVFTLTPSGATYTDNNSVYREITPGVNLPQFAGEDTMKKVYVRWLPLGSLF